MNLLKTSFLTLISTGVKLLSGLVINKAVSIFIGPAGLAMIGQFQNASQLLMTLAQGGINSGVVKYTAQYGKDSDELPKLWSTAAKIVLACSSVIGLGLFVFSTPMSSYVLKSAEYSYIYKVFGLTLICFSLNQLLLSVINGLKEIRLFILTNITQSFYSLIFTSLLIIGFGLDGALIALVTNQSVIFVTLVWRLREHKTIIFERFKNKFDSEQGKRLGQYSLMALTSACSVPLSHFLIRNYIGENLSWEDAGYWQAIWYISSMYLMVVTTALSTYYLPRLSEITSKTELKNEIKQGYAIILPLVLLLSVSIFFLKDFIVLVLFTEKFEPMIELFRWQLMGDVIKIMSWLLGMVLIAKAKIKAVVISDVCFSILFVILSMSFVHLNGLEGVTQAYLVNYVCHFIAMAIIFYKKVIS